MYAGFQLDFDVEVEFEAELEAVLFHHVGLAATAGVGALGCAKVLRGRGTAHGDLAAPFHV